MDLRFSPEENAFRDRAAHLLSQQGAGSDPQQGDGGPPPRQGGDGRLAQGPARQGPRPCRTGPRSGAAPTGRPCSTTSTPRSCSSTACRSRCPSTSPCAGRSIIAFGTEEQKKRFLPRMASLDDWWCQGFSEPGAGSDLAGLTTTAVRKGDHYVVNGQKTWTTLAQYADWIFCLVPHRSRRQEAARHLLPADRHEDAGHHRAADPDDGRRPRGQRGVLRRRQGAGREPGRPGEPRLGLRQVPARQRAHRHRPRRLLQAARAAHQGAGVARSWPATGR